jgi:hypothetical protein
MGWLVGWGNIFFRAGFEGVICVVETETDYETMEKLVCGNWTMG